MGARCPLRHGHPSGDSTRPGREGRQTDRPYSANGYEPRQIPVAEIRAYPGSFNPVTFNADDWWRSPIPPDEVTRHYSQHHDDFAMYASVTSTIRRRDAVPTASAEELAAACRGRTSSSLLRLPNAGRLAGRQTATLGLADEVRRLHALPRRQVAHAGAWHRLRTHRSLCSTRRSVDPKSKAWTGGP